MTTYALYKETALPGSLAPNAIYMVAPAAHPEYLEIYVTNSAGDAQRRTPTVDDVQALIDASAASANGTLFADDIADRDALTPTDGMKVLVLNASADPTVNSGAATYVYRSSNTTWIKISEAESMDLTLNWASIVGRPTSSAAAIDTAVANSHTHANKTQLDKVGEASGEMTYNGNHIAPRLESANW